MFRIALGHVSPNPITRKMKQYSPTSLTNAYIDVKDKKLSVSKAAKFYGVPDQTLRDRVNGRINPENVTYGRGPLFSVEEEARLVRHIQEIAAVGYGYTRAEVVNLASEYAVLLLKRDKDSGLTQKWFYGLLARWPELKVYRPKTLSELRSKACSADSFHKYFEELGRILDKYQLKDKPQNIYNVDEKGIQQNFKPTYVVSSAAYVPSVVTSERSATTTILGCGNAIGYQVPPYFVFQGARMRDELLEGCCTGAQGTVSKSGWSNSTVFLQYLQTHFIKYVKSGPDDHVLLLYDGHRSHISPFLVDWAAENNIILFVLPPHTSHILQPMDVGCFGPFSKIYSDECQKLQRSTGSVINRYNVCSVACKAYTKGLAPANLQSAFRKCGVYPYNPSAIDPSVFIAEQTRKQFHNDQPVCVHEHDDGPVTVTECVMTEAVDTTDATEPVSTVNNITQSAETAVAATLPSESAMSPTMFFAKKRPVFVPPLLKSRRSVSKVVAGKAMTEPEVSSQLRNYFTESQSRNKKAKFQPPIKSKSQLCKSKKKQTSTNSDTTVLPHNKNIAPSTSGLQKTVVIYSDSDDDSVDDSEMCCVCGKFSPDALRNLPYIEFSTWGQCEFQACGHWVHLKYCCPVRVLRRHDHFYCPCHGLPWKGVEE